MDLLGGRGFGDCLLVSPDGCVGRSFCWTLLVEIGELTTSPGVVFSLCA